MNQLAKIEVTRQALLEAKEIHDVKIILDKAEAIKHFVKQQNCTIEIQNYANIFCIEAQIKLGEMLKEMPKNEGGTPEKKQYKNSTGTKIEPVEKQPATYAELNIDKKDASKWQNMANNKEKITEKTEEYKEQGTHLSTHQEAARGVPNGLGVARGGSDKGGVCS